VIRLAIDENFDHHILRALMRRVPNLDSRAVMDAGLAVHRDLDGDVQVQGGHDDFADRRGLVEQGSARRRRRSRRPGGCPIDAAFTRQDGADRGRRR
jgi:hypothetical protein